MFALIEGRSDGWWTRTRPVSLLGVNVTTPLSPVPVAAAIGAASLVAFAFVERRRNRLGQAVLLDFGLFSIPSFRNGNIAAGIVSLGEFGIIFALPLWIENVLGLTAFDTGLILLPLAVGSFAASGFGARSARPAAPCSWCGSASRSRSSACSASAWPYPRIPRRGNWSFRCSFTAPASAWPPRS